MMEAQERIDVAILEGQTVLDTPRVSGAPPGTPVKAMLSGPMEIVRLDGVLLSHHLLFRGSLASGKTNAMLQRVCCVDRSRAALQPRPRIVVAVTGRTLDR
jgi:hypothetical protein